MTAEFAADKLFAGVESVMQRTPPLRGYRLWGAASLCFLVFLIPAFLLACWILWHVIAESLEKPEGC